MSDDQEHATRGDLNAGLKSLRERIDSNKESTGERLARIEALLLRNGERELADAEDRGRTNARLEILERQQKDDRESAAARAGAQDLKIWGLVVAFLMLVVGLVKSAFSGGPR